VKSLQRLVVGAVAITLWGGDVAVLKFIVFDRRGDGGLLDLSSTFSGGSLLLPTLSIWNTSGLILARLRNLSRSLANLPDFFAS
jgi:hypothetical protein